MKRVEAAGARDQLVAGTQVQVIGVAEDDLGARVLDVAERDPLHRAARADRHERRRLHRAVRRLEHAAPRGAVAVGDAERERLRAHGSGSLDGSGDAVRYWYSDIVKRLRVGVLYGGRSGEHEVSLASAASVFAHLDRTRYEPVPIRIEKDGRWALADKPPAMMIAGEVIEQARVEASRPMREGREVHFVARPSDETILSIDRSRNRDAEVPAAVVTGLALDVIFPMLHGPYGEDGTIQGLLELANIPYVGAGVLASAVGMDKAVMKVLFAARGLPVCPYRVVLRHEWKAEPDTGRRATSRRRSSTRCS